MYWHCALYRPEGRALLPDRQRRQEIPIDMNDGVSGDELRFNLDLPVVQKSAIAAS